MGEKSFIAKIEERILRHNKLKFMDSKDAVDEFLAKRSKTRNKPVKSIFKSIDLNGMQVFAYGNEKKSENVILYIHGGAYALEINIQHHLFCMKLSRKLDAYVVAPVYMLAPCHKAEENFDAIVEIYKHLLTNHKNITLMGDSAGGGFVLSFSQYLNTLNMAQPKHIVAISPWVDVSMSNPPYDNKNDCILGEVGLKEIGKSWAGDIGTKDYRVSPIFGDNAELAKTLIFAGENEIFYKDIVKYVQNLKDNGVDVKFITGKGMFHIYPLFPCPEARKAFKEIEKEII